MASGFTKLAAGDRDGAVKAFTESATHPKSHVGMLAAGGELGGVEQAIADLTANQRFAEAALVGAGAQIATGRIDEAVATLDRLLTSAPPGPSGWIIPIELRAR